MLIVVYNLKQEEFEETHTRVKEIEKAIVNAMLRMPEFRIGGEEICFSFPQDPTVTSDEVPVAVTVDLLRCIEDQWNSRQRLSETIASAIKSLPGNEKRTVVVSVRSPAANGFCIIR